MQVICILEVWNYRSFEMYRYSNTHIHDEHIFNLERKICFMEFVSENTSQINLSTWNKTRNKCIPLKKNGKYIELTRYRMRVWCGRISACYVKLAHARWIIWITPCCYLQSLNISIVFSFSFYLSRTNIVAIESGKKMCYKWILKRLRWAFGCITYSRWKWDFHLVAVCGEFSVILIGVRGGSGTHWMEAIQWMWRNKVATNQTSHRHTAAAMPARENLYNPFKMGFSYEKGISLNRAQNL